MVVAVFTCILLPGASRSACAYHLRSQGTAVSIRAQEGAAEQSGPEADESARKKKVGLLALFWLTVLLLFMMFFLSVLVLLARKRRRPQRKPTRTVLEDLWWKTKDVIEDQDERGEKEE
jgi:hypothetical protein